MLSSNSNNKLGLSKICSIEVVRHRIHLLLGETLQPLLRAMGDRHYRVHKGLYHRISQMGIYSRYVVSAIDVSRQPPLMGEVKNRSPYPQFQPFARPQQPPSSFQPSYQAPTSYTPAPQQSNINLGSLHRDIEALIAAARHEFAATPWEPAIQERLKALLDLQTIVTNQQLPPDQILLIQTQVAQLSNTQKLAMPTPAPAPPPAPTLATPPVSQQPDLQALFSSNALANLLASANKAQQLTATPPLHQVQLPPTPIPSSQPPISAASISAGGENPLIASLRAAGMLPPNPNTPLSGAVNSTPTPFGYPPPPTTTQTPQLPTVPLPLPFAKKQNDVQLTSASLKM